MRRTEQRRAAVVALYQHDLTGRPLVQTLPRDAHDMTRALAYAAEDRSGELDALIERHAHGWTVARLAPLERSILRVALIEMLHPDAVPAEVPIPVEGAIDEAVQTAKTFCGAEAPGFVNGILAAILREVRENEGPGGPRAREPEPSRGVHPTNADASIPALRSDPQPPE